MQTHLCLYYEKRFFFKTNRKIEILPSKRSVTEDIYSLLTQIILRHEKNT